MEDIIALSRKMLSGMGLTAEQVDAIIEEHISSTDALKAQRDEYKEKAEKLPQVQKELDDLKKDVSDNDWKGKFDKEHAEFENFKKSVNDKENVAKVKEAYKSLLVKCKIGEKQIGAIMRVTDFSDMKIDKDGNLENAEKHEENINNTWSGFISSTEIRGTGAETPPKSDGTPNGTGRAAELAAKHYKDLYGDKEG